MNLDAHNSKLILPYAESPGSERTIRLARSIAVWGLLTGGIEAALLIFRLLNPDHELGPVWGQPRVGTSYNFDNYDPVMHGAAAMLLAIGCVALLARSSWTWLYLSVFVILGFISDSFYAYQRAWWVHNFAWDFKHGAGQWSVLIGRFPLAYSWVVVAWMLALAHQRPKGARDVISISQLRRFIIMSGVCVGVLGLTALAFDFLVVATVPLGLYRLYLEGWDDPFTGPSRLSFLGLKLCWIILTVASFALWRGRTWSKPLFLTSAGLMTFAAISPLPFRIKNFIESSQPAVWVWLTEEFVRSGYQLLFPMLIYFAFGRASKRHDDPGTVA